jgi:MYXO-CTERM domain-containing protein
VIGWLVVLAMSPGATQLADRPTGEEIIGGELVVSGEYDEVVAVHVAGYLCSGTRVAPGLVLTAAHCFSEFVDLADISVSTGLDALDGPRRPAIAYGVHPEFCPECIEDRFDYGFVQVAPGSLGIDALAVPIADQAEWDEAVRRGADVTIVGYGEDPGTGAAPRTKRKVTVAIDDASASGQEFAAGGDFRDSCRGDSGGPAFIELPSGARRQVGITSRGSKPCGRGGTYAIPYPALGWLRERTGVDLCGEGCSTCDCLDTTPPPDAPGCGCTTSTPGGPAAMALLLLVPAIRRRHRLSTTASAGLTRDRP